MGITSVSTPLPIFNDIDGDPLKNGYIYLGEVNLNPEVSPKQAYWDEDMLSPAAQPIRTIGGYPSRSGAPARLYVADDASITVRNKNGTLIFTSPSLQSISSINSVSNKIVASFIDMGSLVSSTDVFFDGQSVSVTSFHSSIPYVSLQGGGSVVEWLANGDKSLHNGGTIIDPDRPFPTDFTNATQVAAWLTPSTGTGIWAVKDTTSVDFRQFGAKGDDTTDNSLVIQKALSLGYESYTLSGGTFKAKALTATANTIREIKGTGVLKLADAANTFLLNFTGTNECVVSITFDGNKANQSGGTQATRGNYILVNLTDATTVGTTFDGAKFQNSYYGAALNNSSIRTTIKNCFFYNNGNAADGTSCDAVFNGTSAQYTQIIGNYIWNSTDYGLALDTSDVIVENNFIVGCAYGMGSLTRTTQVNHRIRGNTILECVKPLDYFNTTDPSATANDYFSNILITENTIYSTVCVTSALSFSGNNTLYKLFEDVSISGNTIYTPNANNQTAIFLSSAAAAHSKRAKIYNNTIIGDYLTASARYAINIVNIDDFEMHGNTLSGVDLGISITNGYGLSYGNTFDNLRDCYSALDGVNVDIREDFKNVSRRAMMIYNGTILKFTGSFENVDTGLLIFDNAGALPATYSELDITVRGTKTNTIFVDGTLVHQVNFVTDPIQITPFISNVIQTSWNLQQAPTTGTWTRGNKAWAYLPTVGLPTTWYCTVSGSPGTWVAGAVL